MLQKQAQVDVLVEDEAAIAGERDVAERADLLVHRRLVAGQRHHLAELRQRQQEIRHAPREAHRLGTVVRGEELGLGDPAFPRQVAAALAGCIERLRCFDFSC